MRIRAETRSLPPLSALLVLGLVLILASACSAAPAPAIVETVVTTEQVEKEGEVEGTARTATTQEPLPTSPVVGKETLPPGQGTREPAAAEASPTPLVERRQVELEWPASLRYGDSDTVRLSLVPSAEGYTMTADFPEHNLQAEDLPVRRIGGYGLSAVARLEGVTFAIAPSGDQERSLPEGERVDWRWTLTPRQTGRQRLAVLLLLRWTPLPGAQTQAHESIVYSKALSIQVVNFLGLTRTQAAAGGLFGLILGGGLSLGALASRKLSPRPGSLAFLPNPALVIEPHAGLKLNAAEGILLRSLFHRYARLVLESEFLSGYSGARTFLALPIRADGRADAYTIVKMGSRSSIQREFENYEAFVKDTLPPVTARIQHPPVSLPPGSVRAARRLSGQETFDLTAIQYTFIAEPGRSPTSLRQSLCANPDPSRLLKLFDTFGPSWWMQRQPYTFHLAQEYDLMLPAHLVVEPWEGRGRILDGRSPPAALDFKPGDKVDLHHFTRFERRLDGRSLSLRGSPPPGQPVLRVRWQGPDFSEGAAGRVVATRGTMLRGWTEDFNRFGLPDPLDRLPALLDETVSGTRSVIHGDLNLENVLAGPGDFVWLIDFAQTREGHTLFDFAHLYAELVAHVIAPQIPAAKDFLALLTGPDRFPYSNLYSLLSTLDDIAQRCLFNPSQPREYLLARFAACLGALKFANLSPSAKHLLFLAAAHTGQWLGK